jgi:hypothetical protein
MGWRTSLARSDSPFLRLFTSEQSWNTGRMSDPGVQPGVIRFSNPIDRDAPPIDAEVDLVLSTTADGRLRQPLQLPTPSLVFRIQEKAEIVGFTGIIEHATTAALTPGAELRVRVRFVGAPASELSVGRTFAVWHGRDVGIASVRTLMPRDGTAST